MKNLKTVTAFTISEMVRRKSFIISTLVILIIIALAFNIPNIMKKLGNDGSGEKVLIIDPENLFEGMISKSRFRLRIPNNNRRTKLRRD